MKSRLTVIRWIASATLTLFAERAANAQPLLELTGSTVGTTRLMRIEPSASDKWVFSQIWDFVEDTNRQLYVLDELECRIYVFNADGKFVRILGREGSGPGEFRRPKKLQIFGDTVYVRDGGNQRFVSFSASTGKVLPNNRARPAFTHFQLSPTGAYHFATATKTGLPQSNVPVTINHTTAAGATSRVGQYTRKHGSFIIRVYRDRLPARSSTQKGGQSSREQPFDDGELVHASSDAKSIIIVERSSRGGFSAVNPLSGSAPSGAITIRRIDQKGNVIASNVFRVSLRPLSATDIDAVVDSFSILNVLPTVKFVARPSEIRDSLFIPKVWPPTTEVFPGADGSIWLRQPSPPAKTARFWRIDAKGTVLAPVSVSSQIRVVRVTADQLWGVVENDDGEPVIEVHRVNRN